MADHAIGRPASGGKFLSIQVGASLRLALLPAQPEAEPYLNTSDGAINTHFTQNTNANQSVAFEAAPCRRV